MSRTAFVAMKFNNDSWNDKKYKAISEVLTEVGYTAIRADQIRTSGAAVEELLRALSDADIVVVDVSGQSHNVSYELGFCHGNGRDPSTLILVCDEREVVPFNYAHFRRYNYKDLGHLRRLLRHRLNISAPLTGAQMAYAFCFEPFTESEYGSIAADVIVTSLAELKFSGRCEYYAGSPLFDESRRYVVGLGLRTSQGKKPTNEWWRRLEVKVVNLIAKHSAALGYDRDASEFVELRALRRAFPSRGVVEFNSGSIGLILNSEAGSDSWLLAKATDMSRPDGNLE